MYVNYWSSQRGRLSRCAIGGGISPRLLRRFTREQQSLFLKNIASKYHGNKEIAGIFLRSNILEIFDNYK